MSQGSAWISHDSTLPAALPFTNAAPPEETDVLIVGGGVTGAAVFHEATSRGHHALLVDKGDFAGGTSQASGMLAWGGLLYLRNLEFRTVAKLCRARDEWISGSPDEVEVAPFRYLPLRNGGRSASFVRLALETYWHLGGRRRSRPFRDVQSYPFLKAGRFQPGLAYEEAAMVSSDARVTLDRVLGAIDRIHGYSHARNYCALSAAQWQGSHWDVELEDARTGEYLHVRAKSLVNAAGVWADGIAELASLRTVHRHALSKGVYLVIRRPAGLDQYLAFEMGEHGDTLTLTPWGPAALWGPTETMVESTGEGFVPDEGDVRFLLEQANRNFAAPVARRDILALRCGIRPLAVKKSHRRAKYPLDLSRKHAIDVDREKCAMTLFGGKFTSAAALATKAVNRLEQQCNLPRPSPKAGKREAAAGALRPPVPTNFRFADHEARWIDPTYSRDHEACWHLGDYLRRRTSIAQWTPRMGLGTADSNLDEVARLAEILEGERGSAAVESLVAAANLQDDLLDCAFMNP